MSYNDTDSTPSPTFMVFLILYTIFALASILALIGGLAYAVFKLLS